MTAGQERQSIMTDRVPAEAFHPSEFIKDEMDARGWSLADLVKRMPGDYGINYVALDFYLSIGPEEPGLRMGDNAGLGQAFGVDPEYLNNLEKAWLSHPTTQAKAAKELH